MKKRYIQVRDSGDYVIYCLYLVLLLGTFSFVPDTLSSPPSPALPPVYLSLFLVDSDIRVRDRGKHVKEK